MDASGLIHVTHNEVLNSLLQLFGFSTNSVLQLFGFNYAQCSDFK